MNNTSEQLLKQSEWDRQQAIAERDKSLQQVFDCKARCETRIVEIEKEVKDDRARDRLNFNT